MIDAIILDTETTGVEEGKAEVIELYWQSYGNLPTSGLHQFYFPKGDVELGAVCAHHIFLEDLQGAPPASQAPRDIPTVEYWIGHKIDFDWRMLGRPQVKRICTLAMARYIWPMLELHTLSALTYFLFGRTSEVRQRLHAAHGAAVDVRLCKDVLEKIMEIEGLETLEEVYSFSEQARIPQIMSFGKYKGQPVSAVDKGWANWYARQPDTDEYLITALRKARKL